MSQQSRHPSHRTLPTFLYIKIVIASFFGNFIEKHGFDYYTLIILTITSLLGDFKKDYFIFIDIERFFAPRVILTQVVDFYAVMLKTYTLKPIIFFKKI